LDPQAADVPTAYRIAYQREWTRTFPDSGPRSWNASSSPPEQPRERILAWSEVTSLTLLLGAQFRPVDDLRLPPPASG